MHSIRPTLRTVLLGILIFATVGCGPNDPGKRPLETTISPVGLRFVRLQDSLASIQPQGSNLIGMRDTLEHANGYIWLSRILDLQDGQIILDGDFIDDRQATQALIDGSQVNRIRIESPSFETQEGLKVGSTFAELMKAFRDSTLYIDPLPDYQMLQVQVPNMGMFYLFEEPKLLENGQLEISPGDLPSDLPIRAIVVM
ncbi:MAG: hypothetical protein AAF804_17990 [Bacteroidota bacterium]